MLRRYLEHFKKMVDNPKRIILFAVGKGLFNFMPNKPYLKLLYYCRMGKRLDVKNPHTFNEKIQWLKLYNHKPLYTQLVDKYEVRKYIKKAIGKEYLIPLLGVYDKFEDINFDKIPNQFVLKCTHDSGGLVICSDKEKFDIEKTNKKISKCLKKNYYYHGREWPYKNVKPRIICEQYMVDESGTELKDFKLMCFNGEVKCILVCQNRNSDIGLNIDFYDMHWKPMYIGRRHHPRSGTIIPRPKTFKKMVEFAEKLSSNIPFVRVDFYEVNGQLYFGELTFFPGSGCEEFTPESADFLLGSWLELPSRLASELIE